MPWLTWQRSAFQQRRLVSHDLIGSDRSEVRISSGVGYSAGLSICAASRKHRVLYRTAESAGRADQL